MLRLFEDYFTSVTNGRYMQDYNYIGMAITQADFIFEQRNNGVGILNRPDLHESYASMVQDVLRNMGAPIDLEREVGTRLNEFIKLQFGVI